MNFLSLIDKPETWVLLVLAAGALLFQQATRTALAGVLCYGLSYALSTAWNFAPGNHAVLAWEGGMVGVLLMYVAFAGFVGAGRARCFLLVPLVLLLQFAGIDRHILEFIVKAAIAAVILMAFLKISINEPISKMVCAALLVAEGWAIIEKLACPYLPQPFNASSQCGRVFGTWEPFAVTIIIAVFLSWIGIRLWQNRPPQT